MKNKFQGLFHRVCSVFVINPPLFAHPDGAGHRRRYRGHTLVTSRGSARFMATDINKQIYGLEAVNYSFHEKEHQQDMILCVNLTQESGKRLRNKLDMDRKLPVHTFAL